jgi:hypothetical protein
VQPIDPKDDARLDELLSHARWPEPSTASTRRLQATWAGVSPAGRSRRVRWAAVGVAAAAAVVIGIGLTAAMLVSRKSADVAHEQRAMTVIRPQTLPAPVAATRRTALRDVVRLASITDNDMIASEKLAIWSEIRRPFRTGRSRRAAVAIATARAPTRQPSRPLVNTIPPAPEFDIDAETDATVLAMRIQLARD